MNRPTPDHSEAPSDHTVLPALDVTLDYHRRGGPVDDPRLRTHPPYQHLVRGARASETTDMPRFAELNAAASFTLAWGDTTEWTINLELPALGSERVARLYPIRSLLAAGAVVLGGSDWIYGDLDPLVSIETGITRDDAYGPISTSDFEVFDDETVDLATLIDAYTINGAWQLHAEDRSGSIEVGKRADMVIYDRNLFEIPTGEISEATVDLTLFDGRVVYRRPDKR